MTQIYVTKDFKQGLECVIVDDLPGAALIETDTPEEYNEWLIEGSDDVLFEERTQKCIRRRKSLYDKLNQDELRFDDVVNNTTLWVDAITAIKAKLPKPV